MQSLGKGWLVCPGDKEHGVFGAFFPCKDGI